MTNYIDQVVPLTILMAPVALQYFFLLKIAPKIKKNRNELVYFFIVLLMLLFGGLAWAIRTQLGYRDFALQGGATLIVSLLVVFLYLYKHPPNKKNG